jgi:phospholipid/cholesterol/gamma-HCH transport system substrate-binding protein
MTTAIRKHLGDFIAVIVLFVMGVGIAVYILHQERLRFPLVEEKPFVVKAELPNAQAVQPGQGQTIRVAGVEVGQIGKVELEDGVAVVELQMEPKYEGLVRKDATALLRTKTGLKDMFMEVDPGDGKPLPAEGRIQVDNTEQDIDPDEFLAALDADTRDYLKLLISGAGKGLKGRGSDLRETLARFGPLHRDLARLTKAVARRRSNLRRLINRYGLLVRELGTKDSDLTRLVQQSNAVFDAFASEDVNVSRFVEKLPGTLRQTQSTLGKVDRLGQRLGPALESLRPAFRKLDDANAASLPLFREGTPILRNQVRPFARASQPFNSDLGQAADQLAKAGPDLTKTFRGFNRLFNIGANNPGGAQGLTGNLAADRARDEGYLYHLGWLAQNTVSLFSTSDAQGPFRRFTAGGVSCSVFAAIAGGATGNLPEELKDQVNGVATTLGLPAVTNPSEFSAFLAELGVCGGG